MKTRVMIIDEDQSHLKAVKEYFSSSNNIEVIKTISNSNDALESLNLDYDVLVINMLLSGMESFTILSKIRELKLNKLIIATSEFLSPDMLSTLNIYEPNYFLKKPYTIDVLEKLISSIGVKLENVVDNTLKISITDLLHSLGIPSHIKGFQYIRDGIELMYKDKNYINAVTKELYPAIAKKYETTSSRVERAIRHAIEISWMRGDYDLMDELFGNSVDFDRSKPTNSEFIVTLTDRLKLNNHEE